MSDDKDEEIARLNAMAKNYTKENVALHMKNSGLELDIAERNARIGALEEALGDLVKEAENLYEMHCHDRAVNDSEREAPEALKKARAVMKPAP